MIEPPDLAKFGRSEQLHAALFGISQFAQANGRYPAEADHDAVLALTNAAMDANQKADEGNLKVEIEADVFRKAVSWTGSSISPMSAFFGGIIA